MPIVAVGGIIGVSELVTYPIQDPSVRLSVATGISSTAGLVAGLTGVVADYVDDFKDLIDNFLNANSKVGYFRTNGVTQRGC